MNKATCYSTSGVGFGTASTINSEERDFGGLQSKHSFGQQETSQLCRKGNSEDLKKSEDGQPTTRAGKRESNNVMSENWM